MAVPKIVFSIPVHENPRVIVDQILNLQKFVPGAAVVLHVNKNFYLWGKRGIGLRIEPYLQRVFFPYLERIPNVFINDQRLVTQWGNIAHVHLANFRFAQKKLDFDYFVIISSSCMLVRPGAADLMASYDYGVALPTPPQSYEWRMKNENDPPFVAIVKDSGATEFHASQSEGTYYRKEAFAQMADIIDRNFTFAPGHIRVHEEVYFPTVASTLGGRNGGSPIVLKKNEVKLPPIDQSLVDRIRKGDLEDFRNLSVPGGIEEQAVIHYGSHIYGLRPVPRSFDNPLRAYIRSLSA